MADPTAAPRAVFKVNCAVTPSPPDAIAMLVRYDAFCLTPVMTAPASADERNDRSGTGFCCEPNVPGFAPVGSTFEVRQRIPTGLSDVKRTAPADPTGRLSSVPRMSVTSRIFPAGIVKLAEQGSLAVHGHDIVVTDIAGR